MAKKKKPAAPSEAIRVESAFLKFLPGNFAQFETAARAGHVVARVSDQDGRVRRFECTTVPPRISVIFERPGSITVEFSEDGSPYATETYSVG